MAEDAVLVSDGLAVELRPWRGARLWRNARWFFRRKPLGAFGAVVIVVSVTVRLRTGPPT